MIIFYTLIFITTGIITGIISSVFGMGGGTIIVPIFYIFFYFQGYSNSITTNISLGSSMAVMLFTVIGSIIKHYREKNILLQYVKPMFLFVGIGAILGIIFHYYFHHYNDFFHYIFSFFILSIIIYAIFNKKFTHSIKVENKNSIKFNSFTRIIVGLFIGIISILLGIGGSVISVPYFRKHGLPMINASACALSLIPIVSIFGLIGYIINGWNILGLPPYSIGFVNVPAAIFIIIGSFIGISIGIHWTKKIKDEILAKIYILILSIIFLSMFLI